MMPPSAAPLLSVDNLSVQYESGRSIWGVPSHRDVIHDVSFSISPGKTFGLVGESGSGKSTIGKAILRQIPIKSGKVNFNGQCISEIRFNKTPLAYRQSVQAVFQNPLMSLNPRMLARETIAEAVSFHAGLADTGLRRRVNELFDSVGLASRLGERFPKELSGGQQQRVAIARALASNPKLVVCDEAVSALDVSTQVQVISLLRKLQDEHGVSFLFISHDLGVVRSICDSVGVLHGGRFVDIGDVETVYQEPKSAYTRALLGAVPKHFVDV